MRLPTVFLLNDALVTVFFLCLSDCLVTSNMNKGVTFLNFNVDNRHSSFLIVLFKYVHNIVHVFDYIYCNLPKSALKFISGYHSLFNSTSMII